MSRHLVVCLAFLGPLALLAAWPGVVAAAEPVVSASATEVLRPLPSAMRMELSLSARGSSVESALAALKDRRNAALVGIEVLAPSDGSIEVGEPVVSRETGYGLPQPAVVSSRPYTPADPVYAPMPSPSPAYASPRMVAPAPSIGAYVPGSSAIPLAPAPPDTLAPVPDQLAYLARTTVSADWPLPSGGIEAVLIAAEKLERRIREAGVDGGPPTQTVATLATVSDDMAPVPRRYPPVAPAPETVAPAVYPTVVLDLGLPQFVYVATCSPEQRKEGLARAFAKARRQAEELAAVAGKDLGELVSLTGRVDTVPDNSMPYGSTPPMISSMPVNIPPDSPRSHEATAVDPQGIQFHCRVDATFRLP